MEDILSKQSELSLAMEKVLLNFKKDGPDRKTFEYIKKRLGVLDHYWEDYHTNHLILDRYEERDYSYFSENHYDNTSDFYKQARAYIIQHLPSEELAKLTATPKTTPSTSQGGGDHKKPHPTKKPTVSDSGSKINSKLDEIFRKQAANFKAFRRTVANINLTTITERWEFEDTLRTLQSRWGAIDSLHWDIESQSDQHDEEYEELFNVHEKQYIELKKSINSKMWSVAHREKSTPQLEIPVFSGNYNNWVSFKDLFNEAIHSNPTLSNAQKMQFLKSKVRGEAERLIQHLPISSENYLVSWDILNHRFNNKKLIFSSHLNILLSLPNIQHNSIAHIKKMHDVTTECLHAIKNLEVDITTWDPIIVHILSQKLDSETHTEYIQSLKSPRELPILQEFLDYLESKFTSMESARRKQDNIPQKSSNQQINNQQTNQNQSSFGKGHQLYQSYNYYNKGNRQAGKSFHLTSLKCPLCSNEHGIYNCKMFLDLSNEQKLNTVNKLHLCINCLFSHNGKNCISTKTCRKCPGKHNTLLHDVCKNPLLPPPPLNNNEQKKQNENKNSHVSQGKSSEILLSTAIMKVKGANGYHNMRALIDQGSQISLITENAAQLLGIKRQRCQGTIFGVGQNENSCKGMINIECTSLYNDYKFQTDVLIMNNLIKNLPNNSFSKPSWDFIENINLADPEFYVSRPVDLLLGADIYSNILLSGMIKGENTNQPIAQQTQFGWLLCGNAITYQCNVVLNNLENIQSFWEVEDITEQSNLSVEDQYCIKFYSETTNRREDGRYEVRLPFHEDMESKLGSSKRMAIAQLRNLERKFQKQESLANDYKTFINEYQALDHMKPATTEQATECYLPHHGVERMESTTTKYRVVFNASAKTSSGHSLNDLMHKGPNLQQDLQSLLLKLRQYRYAYTADIEKMYRQILINEQDQLLHKIVWRENLNLPIQSFQLTTVTYGTKAAPFLAMMTLKRLAADERERFPEAASVLESSFYMDDLVHGSHTLETGKKLITDLNQLLLSGGFKLRKWSSNEPKLLDNISNQQSEKENVFNFKSENISKTLGLCWKPKEDKFTFICNISKQTSKPTKRGLLSSISRLFDPLGWLAPLSTKLKLLFQKLWKQNLKWDDKVSEEIYKEWIKINTDINIINQCEIPRWIQCQEHDVIELHGFCDASIEAYGCVVYAKIKNKQKTVLVAAKTKLVPYKKALTLPKLELCGAHLLSKLMNKILQALEHYQPEVYGWTDSMVTLGWLQGNPNRWKPFVANRVHKTINIIPANQWRYIKSSENPADAASRGLYAPQLKENTLWWQGPSWLPSIKLEQEQKHIYTTNQEEKHNQTNIIQTNNKDSIIQTLLDKHSSYLHTIRIIAWILRTCAPKRRALPNYITLHELREAKRVIIKYVQQMEFTAEIEHLQKHGCIDSKSKLLNLNPFIDQQGILRVGGRLENAHINWEMKHPKIIPRDSRLAWLLIKEAHELSFHGGPRLTLATLRQQYWIPGGQAAVKKQLRNCIDCRKKDPRKQYQLMGDLPTARINPAPPFYHTGVDYTGFVDIKINKTRSARTTKGYIAVFICMVTKAVHLELVTDLTASAFLAALRRMSARRGAPRHLYSDNGTNFVGANRILQEEYQQLEQIFQNSLSDIAGMSIEWHFNAPSWPTAGGLWERAVRSLKHHMKRVIGEQKMTFEEFCTILTQLEACLNSRPLCPLTENVEDIDYLTPAHFLTGRSGVTIIQTEEDARTRWHLTNKIFNEIWKRWKSEYLIQLTARNKWLEAHRNIKTGDMVVIQEDNLPVGKWSMGRVAETHPGNDGLVRVVTLKTKNGYIKRPITKLSVLPIESSTPENKNKENKHENRKGMPKQTNLASIVMAIIFFMALATNTQANKITDLNNNQSLYFDPLAKMQWIRDQWTIVTYFDMTPYWEGTEAFEKLLNYLESTCTNTNIINNKCNMIISQLSHEGTELRYYNQLLLTQHFSAHARQRRGLINGIGYLANSLFGVLDQRFAEQYSKDIALIRNNQAHVNNLWRNQTTIMESEYNLLKRTENIMAKQHKVINKHLNNLGSAVKTLEGEINRESLLQDFTLSAITASNLLQTLKRIQDTMLDTITDIYQGRFSLHLLTPDQLQKQLNIISGLLSSEVTLPIASIQQDLYKVYQLLQVKARMTEQYFLFEIKVPLISRDTYDLYHIISIPQQIGNSMVSVTPIANFVAINLQKDSYLPLSTDELQECTRKDHSTYFCNIHQPIYKMKSDMDLCITENYSEKVRCKTDIATCQSKLINLAKSNAYLYYCCGRCELRSICGDRVTSHQPARASVIDIGEDCIIKTNNFTIIGHKNRRSQMEGKYEIDIPSIAPINNIINISIDTIAIQENYNSTNDQLYKDIEDRLKVLRKNVLISDEDGFTYHDIHHYTLIYCMIGAAIFVGIIIMCRRVRGRWQAPAAPSSTTIEMAGRGRTTGPQPTPRNHRNCCNSRVQTPIFKRVHENV